jgi:hypothetical protein
MDDDTKIASLASEKARKETAAMMFLFINLMSVVGRMDIRIMLQKMVTAAVMLFMVFLMQVFIQQCFDDFLKHMISPLR